MLQEIDFPSPKPCDPVTHLEIHGDLVDLETHLFLSLLGDLEVQEVLATQFLEDQLDQNDLFHQEVLVVPFLLGIPFHHHPRK